MLAGERLLVDVFRKPHVEQPVLLLHKQRLLPLKLVALSERLGLGVARLRGKYQAEPVADFLILDTHHVEDGQHLLVDVGFRDPHAGMALAVVIGAAVIGVELLTVLHLLADLLARDRMAAVAALNDVAGVGEGVRLVDVPAEQYLHAIPRRPVNQRLMLAGIPLALVRDFADVGTVLQDVVDHAPGKLRLRGSEDPAFGMEPLDQPVKRQVLEGVEVEDAFDVGRCIGINLDDAPPILADVAVAVRSQAHEPAFLNAAGESLADIDRLLLGVETRHVGERPPHHAAGRRVLGRLRNGNERQVVLRLQPFEFDVIEEVAGCPIHLVEEQAIKEGRILLGVGDQLAEGLTFVALAGRLRDAEQLDDLAAGLGGVPTECFFLDFEAEALTLLFPAADPCQCDELLHDDDPEERAWNKRPTVWIIVTASSGVTTAW